MPDDRPAPAPRSIADPLLALSIRQPWAFSIVAGTKRVENRTWRNSFRGPFLIHASKGLTRNELHGWADMIKAEGIDWPGLKGNRYTVDSFERGGIVGIATLDRIVESADDLPADQRPWFIGPYGFVLTDVRALPFMSCPGRLSFFDIPPDVEAAVRALIA